MSYCTARKKSSVPVRGTWGPKSDRNAGCCVWEIAQRKGRIEALPDGRLKQQIEAAEHREASIRAKVENPFRVIKRQFVDAKVRFKGLEKNTAHFLTLFAPANLWMVRKKFPAMTGGLHPQLGTGM